MSSVSLFFAGDFCSKPSTSGIEVSNELKDLIRSCDIRVINFEVPLRPEGVFLPAQRRRRFFQNDDAPDFLRNLGFNLFSIANNHAFDWGEDGFIKTKAVLGDDAFGAGTYDEAYKVKVVEVRNKRIGFLALSFAAYTGVFDDVTRHDGLGCAYINDLRVNHVIIEAKKEVDYLFILPHDGIEYIDIPLPETIARYRDFIDYGADGVIGTHPHCPQGWETYKGKPIFYSLGNFLFNSKESYDFRAKQPHWYEGLCVILRLDDMQVSYDVINTLNVDNKNVVIDHDEKRTKQNDAICYYLSDQEAYSLYLDKVFSTRGIGEIAIIDRTFHSKTLNECTKLLLGRWWKRFCKKEVTDDDQLQRLLVHDARRYMLIRTIKTNTL